mmetsp:Transcript_68084/g.127138  ORF Transcript_68084/g.127138 Transcript_68084/m.127138 type:complete len:434 (+) Transcript_68084:119-1420(+)
MHQEGHSKGFEHVSEHPHLVADGGQMESESIHFSALHDTPLGDPYRFNDDVCRGVAMVDVAFHADGLQLPFDSSPYDTLDKDVGFPDAAGYRAPAWSKDFWSQDAWYPYKVAEASQQQAASPSEEKAAKPWFQAAYIAPAVPEDREFFTLLDTKVELPRGSASDVGNTLLANLERPGVEYEVNTQKYTIKVEVAAEQGADCSAKIRIYRRPDGCVVEFQRRRGCAFAFMALFRRLRGALTGEEVPVPSRQPLPPWENSGDTREEIQSEDVSDLCLPGCSVPPVTPLLDMAATTGSPEQLAEAANGLDAWTVDALYAQSSLCGAIEDQIGDVLKILRQLVCNEHLSVAYPAACAYLRLLLCSTVDSQLEEDEFKEALAMVEPLESNGRKRRRLAQAYRQVQGKPQSVRRCGSQSQLEAKLNALCEPSCTQAVST